jgi:hypothetical protein
MVLYVGLLPIGPLILNTLIWPSPELLYPALGTKLNSKEKGPGPFPHGRLAKETTRSISLVLPASLLILNSKAMPPAFVTLGDEALEVDELVLVAEVMLARFDRDEMMLLADVSVGRLRSEDVMLLADVALGMLVEMEFA